jgi:hypothetical protein
MRRVDLIISSLFLREEYHGKRVLVLQSSLALLKRVLQPFDLPGPHGVRFNSGDIGKCKHSRRRPLRELWKCRYVGTAHE